MSNDTQVQALKELVDSAAPFVKLFQQADANRDQPMDGRSNIDAQIAVKDLRRLVYAADAARAAVEASARQLAEQVSQPPRTFIIDMEEGGQLAVSSEPQQAAPRVVDKSELKRLVTQVFGEDFQIVRQAAPGFVMVPLEPSRAMLEAAQVADMDHGGFQYWLKNEGQDLLRMYRAMVQARPLTAAPIPEQRPQNCGTSFCSCIECPFQARTQKGKA